MAFVSVDAWLKSKFEKPIWRSLQWRQNVASPSSQLESSARFKVNRRDIEYVRNRDPRREREPEFISASHPQSDTFLPNREFPDFPLYKRLKIVWVASARRKSLVARISSSKSGNRTCPDFRKATNWKPALGQVGNSQAITILRGRANLKISNAIMKRANKVKTRANHENQRTTRGEEKWGLFRGGSTLTNWLVDTGDFNVARKIRTESANITGYHR